MNGIGSRLRDGWQRVRGLRRAGAHDERFGEEARFHVDMLTARYIRQGLSEADARRRAGLEFGGMDRFGEAARDEVRSRPVEELWRDVRMAVRNLARMPAFTVTAVLTLALGIGATTVVYSIVDHVVLRPLPYRDAERLVVVREVIEEIRADIPSLGARAPHFFAWREQCDACDDLAMVHAGAVTWSETGEPMRLASVRVSPSLFRMLGVNAEHGRLFLPDEETPERGSVVLLSHGFWQRHFGGNPAVLGSTMQLSGVDRTIVGVLPARFRLPKGNELGPYASMPADPDVYLPMALTQAQINVGGAWNYIALARLADGVTVGQAEAQLTAIQQSLGQQMPEPLTLSAQLWPLQAQVVGASSRGLLLLLAAVGAVLLLVCVNLANLLLARSASRGHEAAVRTALGAGRVRLVREALTESVVLAVVAGAVGIVVALWGLQLLLQLAPADLPRLHEVRLDLRVAGVAVLLSLATGLLFGALPALRTASASPSDALRGSGRSRGDDRRRSRGRTTLIATQVGMTAVLLVAAGLFLTSFVRVLGIDRGFSSDRVLAMDVIVPGSEYTTYAEMLAVYDRLLLELEATPGIEAAAAASKLPLEGITWSDGIAEEGDARPGIEWVIANFHGVSPGYFRTLGIPLRSGEAISSAHRGREVVVLSERAASALWPDGNAVGRRIQLGGHAVAEVIGVAADVTATGLEEAERSPIVYVAQWSAVQFPAAASIAVRGTMDAAQLVAPARAALRRASPGVVIAGHRTMDQVVADAAAARRFQLSLLLLFAGTALVTACVGIYGVVAQSLARRRGEIGVRMALGAQRGTIHRLVLGEGMRAAAFGLVAGVAVVVAAGRLIQGLLYDVRPADPAVLAAVAVVLCAVVAAASLLPAWRATAGDPARTLRQE